jgi:hypothetical protein
MSHCEFGVKFECRKAPSRSAVKRSVNKFEATGNMISNKTGVLVRRRLSKTPENFHCVQ